MAKYKTLTELAAAIKSGELRKGYYLMIDKGGSEADLSFYDKALPHDENDLHQERCGELFDSNAAFGDEPPIFAALKEMGIPAEWC